MKKPDLVQQWLMKAENDLLSADNNLSSENTPFDVVCFHCQQAAEKYLKAFLIANDKQYPFSHDLLLLLEKIIDFDSSFEELRNYLIILMPYAVEVRYPDMFYEPTRDDAIEARESAEFVKNWLIKKI